MSEPLKLIFTTLFWTLGVSAAALVVIGGVYYLQTSRYDRSLVSSGERRGYLLHIPPGYEGSQPVPLVISIHGFAGWPENQSQISRWNRLADQEGFLVVYPRGTGFPLRWRTGDQPGADQDIQFIVDLIHELEAHYAIDPRRIYVNGISNGGGMSFALSCKLSGRIAAFGSVAGAYLLPWDACAPERPVPAMLFHGTADAVVPYLGGPSRNFDLPFPNIPEWAAELARRNGCTITESLPSQGEVSGVRYSGCAEGAEVILYTITGGGHSWPGGGWLPRIIVGKISRDIDATRALWEFFQRHPLREP